MNKTATINPFSRGTLNIWLFLLGIQFALMFATGRSIGAQQAHMAIELQPTESIWAARIALLALRSKANVPPSPAEVQYAFDSLGAVRGLSEAVQNLAQMHKPVACDAAHDGATVILRCTPLASEPLKAEFTRIADRFTNDWANNVREVCGDRNPLVLLSSRQEALLVPFSGVNAFMHEYQIDLSLAWQAVRPNVLPDGVCAFFLLASADKPSSIKMTYDLG